MKNGKFITEWALKTIKEKYSQDIAIAVSHDTLRMDEGEQTLSYFVPVTDKGRSFSQTFILEGEGFDIWGMEWERLEQFAKLEEYNITCLADGKLLYAKSPEDAERFYTLQKQQAENLKNPAQQRARALEAFEEAKQIYYKMIFSTAGDVKLGAGYVIDYLGRCICFANGGYFKKAQTEQLAELRAMNALPAGFADLYKVIIQENNENTQKRLCFELISLVEKVLACPKVNLQQEYNFQDLADWYAELAYTWLRIRHCCKEGDVTKAYMWGCMLHQELNCVCEDFGLEKMDLMKNFDANNLEAFAAHSDLLEKQIRKSITNNGGKIREYLSQEDFLNEI